MSETTPSRPSRNTERKLTLPDELLPEPMRVMTWKDGKEYWYEEPEPAEIKQGWRPHAVEVDGKRVHFYGVAHTRDTLIYHGKELKEAIEGASLVLLEGAPIAGDLFNRKKIENLYKKIQKNSGYRTIDEFIQNLHDDYFVEFYSVVERIAACAGVPIALADPEAHEYKTIHDLRNLDTTVQNTKLATALASASGIIGLAFCEAFRRNPNPSRRSFLLGGGALALTTGVTGTSAMADALETKLMEQGGIEDVVERTGRSHELLDPALYNLMDFRNVVAAGGLVSLIKNFPQLSRKIVVIYGAAHQASIEYYSKHHVERKVRAEMYRPYWSVARPVLSVYTSQGAEHTEDGIQPVWKRTNREKL
ncbi:MAG: hypothetical protein V4449_00890 [Patescibacteria group bacterium]